MDNDQRIQAYLHNRLSLEELTEFDKRLRDDQDFNTYFEEHKAVFMAFKITENERLKSKLKLHEKQSQGQQIFRSKPIIYAIAAIFMVLTAVSVYLNYTQQDLYNQYFEPYPNVYQPVVRSDKSSDLTTAFMYYESGNYDKAKMLFSSLLLETYDPNVDFYYALTLIELDEVEAAIQRFEQIPNDPGFEFSSELLWYKALAYLKVEDYQNASSSLEDLERSDKSYKTENRETLQNAIKSKL
jgi:predicted Zn-dependent protease